MEISAKSRGAFPATAALAPGSPGPLAAVSPSKFVSWTSCCWTDLLLMAVLMSNPRGDCTVSGFGKY